VAASPRLRADADAGLCSRGASDVTSRFVAAPGANAVLAAVASSAQELALATDRLIDDGKRVLEPRSSHVEAAQGPHCPQELRDAAGGAVGSADGASTCGAVAGQKRSYDDISPGTGTK